MVTMLLERGASLNARGATTGRTALDKAREKGWGEIAHALEAAGCKSLASTSQSFSAGGARARPRSVSP